MTDRDFAFWLQGFYELSVAGAEPDSAAVIKHIDLALVSTPKDDFLMACRALVDVPNALRAVIASQFEHVIDATMPPIEKDPAHKPPAHWAGNSGSGPVMRC